MYATTLLPSVDILHHSRQDDALQKRLLSQCIHATQRRFYSAKHTMACLDLSHHILSYSTVFDNLRYMGLTNAVVFRGPTILEHTNIQSKPVTVIGDVIYLPGLDS